MSRVIPFRITRNVGAPLPVGSLEQVPDDEFLMRVHAFIVPLANAFDSTDPAPGFPFEDIEPLHAGTATFLLSHAFWQGEQTILFG